jgi:hypothetical protein
MSGRRPAGAASAMDLGIYTRTHTHVVIGQTVHQDQPLFLLLRVCQAECRCTWSSGVRWWIQAHWHPGCKPSCSPTCAGHA